MLKVCCALIIRKNKLLVTQLGQHSDHPFLWEFPGGKMEKNETEEECICREINEELGVRVKVTVKLKAVIFDYEIKQIQLIPFICEIVTGEIQLKEHVCFKWISKDELKDIDFSGADKKLLQQTETQQQLEKYFGK